MVVRVQADITDAFEEIQARWRSDNQPVEVLMANECDGLCAFGILYAVLERHSIAFRARPVESEVAVVEFFRQKKEQPVLAVLINIGSRMDLHRYVVPDLHTVYVVDSTRPIDHISAASKSITFLLDDQSAGEYQAFEAKMRQEKREAEKERRRAERKAEVERDLGEFDVVDEDSSDGEEDEDDDEESEEEGSGDETGFTESRKRHRRKPKKRTPSKESPPAKRKKRSLFPDEDGSDDGERPEGEDQEPKGGDGDDDSVRVESDEPEAGSLDSELKEYQDMAEEEEDFEHDGGEAASSVRLSGRTSGGESTQGTRSAEAEYYRVAWWSISSSSLMMMHLASGMGFSNRSDILWAAAVGTTAHYLEGKCTRTMYYNSTVEIEEEIERNKPPLLSPQGIRLQDGRMSSSESSEAVFKNGEIRLKERELTLPLLQYWTITDALWHSPYIASVFNLYVNEAAKHDLETLLSKVGVPSGQRTIKFSSVAAETKKKFSDRLFEYGKENGLEKRYLFRRGFCKHHSYAFSLSAADLVSAMNAMLIAPREAGEAAGKAPHGPPSAGRDAQGNAAGEGEETSSNLRRISKVNYWEAFHYLSEPDESSLQRPMQFATQLHRLVANTTKMILQQGLVALGGREFRYVRVPETLSRDDRVLLTSPWSLHLLGHSIADTHRAQWEKKNKGRGQKPAPYQSLPLLVGVFHTEPTHSGGSWLFMGIHPGRQRDNVVRSAWPRYLQEVLAKTKAHPPAATALFHSEDDVSQPAGPGGANSDLGRASQTRGKIATEAEGRGETGQASHPAAVWVRQEMLKPFLDQLCALVSEPGSGGLRLDDEPR